MLFTLLREIAGDRVSIFSDRSHIHCCGVECGHAHRHQFRCVGPPWGNPRACYLKTVRASLLPGTLASYHLRISSAELAPFSTTESFLDNSFDTVRVLHQLSFVPQRRAHESRDFDLARSPGWEISRDRYEIESVMKLVIRADSVLWGARALSTAKKTVLNAFRRSNLVRIRARRLHRAPPECRSKYRTVCQPVRDLARPRSARS